MSNIYAIDSLQSFKRIIERDTPVIVFFYVLKWSTPCEKITPAYIALSDMPEYNSWLCFCKVDCESQPDIASIHGPYPIHLAPTFILYRKGVELGRVVGSNKGPLRELLNKYAPPNRTGSSSYQYTNTSSSNGGRSAPTYGWN
ncbi:hypothetical protein CPB84DRAFT_1783289 [Gymnopilus junonius]|uniref:Thioredoxin domain-containing protein n=1 Tax=Gymnopilus junonius TaxID=109634 RepID=A0A9P5NLM9_GYMJU|nr:hypothetical protein CPB84DRAFT_1783289 [Gymnopilus junonius]